MLNNSNFNIWAIRMQVILEANDLWEVVEPQTTTQIDNKADKTAIAFIFQALPKDQILQVEKHKFARTVWDALKTRHVGENRVQQAKQQTLKFLHIVTSIEQYSNMDNMSLDEAIGRLKTFEERLKCKKERQPDSQERLMFSQNDSQGQSFRARGNYKGKSNQENNYMSDKKNRESSQNNFKKDKRKFVRNLSKTRCYKCKKLGHYAKNCTQKNPEEVQSNLIEEDSEPTLLMATIEEHHEVFLNERNFEPPKTSPGEESLWIDDDNYDAICVFEGSSEEEDSESESKDDVYVDKDNNITEAELEVNLLGMTKLDSKMAVQDALQKKWKLNVSRMKAFRAKAMADMMSRGGHRG
nr:putative zinc finger, CCHC-type [Tanacetum cinerariifolium]